MPNKKIITGQHVPPELYRRSKEMRREMTPAEARLWQRLKANRLEGFHFRRQQVIGRYIADFYCHQAGLVVEVDGGIHQVQVAYDRERDAYLTGLGLNVLRFLNSEVERDMDTVLGVILRACQSRRGTE